MTETATEKWDVVIFEIKTRTVESMAGEDMKLDTGHHNAQRRYETVSPRLNDHYSPAIVPAGKYQKGSIISQTDLDNQP